MADPVSSPWPLWRSQAEPGLYVRPHTRRAPAEVCLDVAAFIGVASRGQRGVATEIEGYDELVAAFGPPVPGYALHESLRLYFDNGGRRAVVINAAAEVIGDTRREDLLGAAALLGGWDARHMTEPVATLCLPDLAFASAPARLEAPPPPAPPLGLRFSDELPTADPAATPPPAPLIPGLHGPLDPLVLAELIAQCERSDRLLLLDAAPGIGAADLASRHVVLLRPWVRVAERGRGREMPAVGAVAGLLARRERERGVAASPSGQSLLGVSGVESIAIQSNTNTIQRTASGLVLNGAYTTHPGEWSSWPTVRLFQYLRRQLALDLAWAVFEPIDERLAHRLETVARRRLDRLMAAGALASERAEDSYRVAVSLHPDDGAARLEVAVAPARPAEWLVLALHVADDGIRPEGADA